MRYHGVILFLICLSIFSCKDDAKNIKASTRSMTLELSDQGAMNTIKYIDVAAEFKIIEEQIYTNRSGEIKEIHVQNGDTVNVTNILASFESEKLKSDISHIKVLLDNEKDRIIRNNELYAKKLISKKDFEEQTEKYDQLRKSYDESLEQLKNSVLYSPVDGVVKTVQIVTNRTVGKNEQAFILTRLDSVDVYCTFEESNQPEISITNDVKLKKSTGEETIYSAILIAVVRSEEKTGKTGGVVLRIKRKHMR